MTIININVDFEMIQGTTKYINCTIYDTDGVTLIDLSDSASIVFGAKLYGQNYGILSISKSVGSGITVNGLGSLTIKLSASDTASLLGKMQYELRVTESIPDGSDVYVPLSGLFLINPKST